MPKCFYCLSIDPIDIVKDPIPPHEYKAEEDPKLYKSVKTKRGPLSEDWIQEYKNNPGKYPIMCAYKLCKVEFRYWGMQSKIERFIHDVGEHFYPSKVHCQLLNVVFELKHIGEVRAMYCIPRHVCGKVLRSDYALTELWVSSEKNHVISNTYDMYESKPCVATERVSNPM